MNLDRATIQDFRVTIDTQRTTALAASKPSGPNAGALIGAAIRANEKLQSAALQNFEALLDAADERDVLRVAVDDLYHHIPDEEMGSLHTTTRSLAHKLCQDVVDHQYLQEDL